MLPEANWNLILVTALVVLIYPAINKFALASLSVKQLSTTDFTCFTKVVEEGSKTHISPEMFWSASLPHKFEIFASPVPLAKSSSVTYSKAVPASFSKCCAL